VECIAGSKKLAAAIELVRTLQTLDKRATLSLLVRESYSKADLGTINFAGFSIIRQQRRIQYVEVSRCAVLQGNAEDRLPCCALWWEDGTIPKHFRKTG